MVWSQLRARLSRGLLTFDIRRRLPQVVHLPPDVYEDVYGLPGDVPTDVPRVVFTISSLMSKLEISWCIVGDLLLSHYCVPKIMEDIEVCLPFDDLRRVQEAFSAETEFCAQFRPGRSYYNRHLAQYPRFRVKGMRQCFFLVPDTHYGLDSKAFAEIMHLPQVDFPLLPLPHYVNGLASVSAHSDTTYGNFAIQIEFLIDGMDLDEEWCNTYLEGPVQEFVRRQSSRSAKKERMGPHPKYDGNLTTYIHDEEERKAVLTVVGRVMADPNAAPALGTLS